MKAFEERREVQDFWRQFEAVDGEENSKCLPVDLLAHAEEGGVKHLRHCSACRGFEERPASECEYIVRDQREGENAIAKLGWMKE